MQTSRSRLPLAVFAAMIVAFAALAALAPPALAQSSCSTLGETTFVRLAMKYLYFWNVQMPDLPAAAYDSPEDYLEAVRYKPLDHGFSFVTDKAANDAFFAEGTSVGLGITTKLLGRDYRVAEVFPASAAADAGMQRGDRFLDIGGRSVESLLASGELGGAFGPSTAGVSVTVHTRDTQGRERTFTMVKRNFTIPTVSLTRAFDLDGRRVGYLHLRTFITPTADALDAAFLQLRAAGVNELVLDERYNGGGLVSASQHLAGLIGGSRTSGQVFAEFFFNEVNAGRNFALRFENQAAALGLQRLFVITTRASASASELIINALRPFIPVTTIGDTSYGKPIGQFPVDFCDKTLVPATFQTRNALHQGDYFDGIPADCAAADDVDHLMGDTAEASLQEALFFIRNGRCSAGARALDTARALSGAAAASAAARETGWQALTNAR